MGSLIMILLSVACLSFTVHAFIPRINLAKEETITRDHTLITKIGLLISLARFLQDNPQYLRDVEFTDFLNDLKSVNSTEAAQTTISNLSPQINFINAMNEIQNANVEVDSAPLRSSAAAHFNGEQFKNGAQRLVTLRQELITALLKGDKLQHARNLAGGILHTLQDFYSNTNWVELGNVQPYEVLAKPGSVIPFEFTADKAEETCRDCSSTPATYEECSNNLNTEKLTSGYRAGQDVQKPVNMGKCSHGGTMDENRFKQATGGINKDAHSITWSPHARLHTAAADLATQATSEFLEDVRTTVGDDIFARFLNLKSEESMALVIDVSGSMSGEIAGVKNMSIEFVRQTLQKRGTFFTYILVPFNDPDWGPVTVTSDAQEVIDAVKTLNAAGGGDCPELGMTGLYHALLHCLPNSNVFYFSDADAKDANRTNEVMSLAKKMKVEITFIISGSCSRRKRELSQLKQQQPSFVDGHADSTSHRFRRSSQGQDVYQVLATETGGQVLRTSKSDVGDVVKIINPLSSANSSADLKEVGLLNIQESRSQNFSGVSYFLDVDSTLQNLIVILSAGSSPGVSVNSVEGNARIQQKTISSSSTLLILEITKLISGSLEVIVSCNGPYSLQVTGSSPLAFTYQLMDVEDLERGTTRRVIGNPLRGHTLLLTLDFIGQEIHAVSNLTLLSLNGTELETFRITQGKGIYRNSYFVMFVPTAESFRLQVTGLENNGTRFQRVKPTLFTLGDVKLSQHLDNKNSSNAIFPGETLSLGIKVVNSGDNQTLFFAASDDLKFVQSVIPSHVILGANESSLFRLTLLAPGNATYGATSTISVFVSQSSDLSKVLNFIVLFVTVASKTPDVTPPSCAVLSQNGSCAGVYGSPDCVHSTWSARVVFNDTGEGLLSITTRENHNGSLSVSSFSKGAVNTCIPASFTSNCCNPKVLLVGLDLVGNMGTCYVSLVPDIVSLRAQPHTKDVSLLSGQDTKVPFIITNLGSKGSFAFHVTKTASLLSYVLPFSLTLRSNASSAGHVIIRSHGEESSREMLTVKAVSKLNTVNRKEVALFDIVVSVFPKSQPTTQQTTPPVKHVTIDVVRPENKVSLGPGASLEVNFAVKNLASPETFTFFVLADKASVTGHIKPSPVHLKTNESVSCVLTLTSSPDAIPSSVTLLNVTAKPASHNVQAKELKVFSLTVKIDRKPTNKKEETRAKQLERWHISLISSLAAVVLLAVVASLLFCIKRGSWSPKNRRRRGVPERRRHVEVNKYTGEVGMTDIA